MTNKKPAKKATSKKATEQTAKPATKKTTKQATKKTPVKAAKKASQKPTEAAQTPESAQSPTPDHVTRPADLADVPAMVAVGNELGFFSPEDTESAVELLTQYFSGKLARHAWLVVELDAAVVGTAYFLPEPETVGTWNLRFLGVSEQHRNKGCGQALLTKIEESLKMTRGRILVETPGTNDLEATHSFLAKNDYSEQARIQDFFDAGVDKVIHLKPL